MHQSTAGAVAYRFDHRGDTLVLSDKVAIIAQYRRFHYPRENYEIKTMEN